MNRWFDVLQCIINNSIKHQSFVFTQMKWLNCSTWPIDRTLSGVTSLGQSGPGNNSNQGVLHIPQSSRTGASPSDCLASYPGHSLGGGLNPLQRCSWYILQHQLTGLTVLGDCPCLCDHLTKIFYKVGICFVYCCGEGYDGQSDNLFNTVWLFTRLYSFCDL